MRKRHVILSSLAFTCLGGSSFAQFNATLVNHGRTNAAITQGITIGNIGATPVPSQAFQVRGDLLGAGSTPEVFRTNAPTTGTTSWRMFQGGTTAGFERGQLFADPSSTHFNINAPQGHLRLLTNTTERARLNAAGNYTIGSFGGQVTSGFFGVSPNSTLWAGGNPGPFSRLHLHDGTPVQSSSYRPWMKNGVTFTGNQDHGFLGQKPGAELDFTDMVLHWSDNPGVNLKDRLRFIFTSGFTGAASGAQSTEGLEAMRIFPIRYDEAYIGFGDFYAANLADPLITEPTERVDVLNGRVRVRELLNGANQAQGPYMVVVADNAAAPSGERGVLKWRDPNQLDCKWQLTTGFNNNLYTAVGPPGVPCPDDVDAVGIGIDLSVNPTPPAKFTVNTAVFDEGASIIQTHADANVYGLRINAQGGTLNNYGARILATASNTSVHNYGLFTEAIGPTPRSRAVSARTSGATFTAYCGEFLAYDAASFTLGVTGRAYGGVSRYGVEALAFAGSSGGGSWGAASEVYGVIARADGGLSSPIGYGIRAGATGSTVDWAGWFDGNVNIVGDIYLYSSYYASDAALKTDVQDVSPSLDVIQALQVHSYQFTDEAVSDLGMPEGGNVGLIAQELEEVLPGLVKEHTVPAEHDSTGAVVQEAFSYKAVNYVALIPYLISAVQKLEADNDDMREQLAACCANPGSGDGRMHMGEEEGTTEGDARSLRIAPNPFEEQTTLYYTLEKAGRAQLLVNSSDGKQLRVLHEATQPAGEFQHVWNTTELAPGLYYVTLLLDGEPVVKKAVRL